MLPDIITEVYAGSNGIYFFTVIFVLVFVINWFWLRNNLQRDAPWRHFKFETCEEISNVENVCFQATRNDVA